MNKKDIEAIYALSPIQQGMLFHSLYAPDSGVYVQQLSCTLRGNLNIMAFERAWQRLIGRHPILRTAFLWQGLDKPLQVVQRHTNIKFDCHDWRQLSPLEQQEHLEAFLQADQNCDFDLAKPPLMRGALIQIAEDTYHFIWTNHHLLLDGWSTPLLFDEVFTYYEAFSRNQELSLPLSRPYRDYITWLKKQDTSKAEAFWRQTLNGVTAPTPLMLERGANSTQYQQVDADYGEQEIQLSLEATAALETFAAKHQLTLNTIVQGAWALLLSRHSRQEDVIFGTTVSGRPGDLAGVESMIGLFINTLPMRVQASANEQLLPWLQKFQAQQVDLRQYEYSSLIEIHGWTEVPRNLPLFESIVVFENYPLNPSLQERVSSLNIQNVRHAVKVNYPLTILAVPESQLLLRIKYDCGRFDVASVAQMLAQLQSLLEQFAKHPEKSLGSYSLITPMSSAVLPDPTAVLPEPQYTLVTDMLTTWVEQFPDKPAICQGNFFWSYAQLAKRALAIAHTLLAQGLKRGDPVAVLGSRSFGLIASMTGVLFSGGVLLPVDCHLPVHRQRFMLQQANAKYLIILGEQLPEDSDELSSLGIIQLHPDTGEIIGAQGTQCEATNLPMLSPDDAAYIFFTSGTTGVPKGILGSHKGLAHFLSWQRKTFAIGLQDRCAQLINISFDVVLRDIFLPLVSGATLCLPDSEDILASDRIFAWLERENITLIHTVPAIVQSWLLNPTPKTSLSHLRHIFLAGEPLTDALIRQWRKTFSQAGTIVNLYGPTETTLAKCFYIVPDNTLPGIQPIGNPLPETQALVVAANGQLCGIGEPGEIVIRTPFRTLGYLNTPDTHHKKFVKNPFGNHPQDLVYYTGDLGCYRADGLLEILGRLDHQVKIRGVRVEPDEVTAVLAQHPAVKSCIAIARQEVENILVAYVVTLQPTQDLTTDLRAYLSQHLPPAMVPSAFVFLEQLPLTANGKVNRQALPAPDLTSVTADNQFEIPQTPVEEIVAGLWSQVLPTKQVSRHANFFDLGGHSLLATQLISRVRDTFQIELPLRRLFETPTVAGLAASIEDVQRAQQSLQLLPLQSIAREQQLPLSFAQQRLWFLEQLALRNTAYNIPGALRISGDLNVQALEQSLNEIIRRHETLRTTFGTVQGRSHQVISLPTSWSLPLVDLRDLPAIERETAAVELVNADAQQPFDLTDGPLLRTTLLCLDENEHILLFTMHHIISDAWSLDILLNELATLYKAFAAGEPSPLPDLPIQYADFAYWQRQWLQGEIFETQLAYWKQQLGSKRLPILDLPTDRPRPPVQTFRGARRSLALSSTLTQALKELSQQSGVTLFMTLLAAFKTLLYRYTRQADIVVGSPIAGRTRSEIEGLIGFFVNTLVLRTDLSGNPTFKEVLNRVREVALGAYAHQDLPFEKLVEELQPERHLSHTPLFQVMFVLHNARQESLTLPGVSLTPLSVEESTAKFDLTLIVQEQDKELLGVLEYNTDLFDGATAERILGHWQTLLESVVAKPEQRLSALPILTPAEQHQLLIEWNDTKINTPHQAFIHELFADQVERTPDVIAVVCENEQLTYRQLNNQANRLAHHLKSLGVRPDVLVGICVERSLEMLVGLMGILKAGGAYLPLDPKYPQERLAFMLEDAQVSVLLTQEQLSATLPKHQAKTVYLDLNQAAIANEQNPESGLTPDNLAYVIYTSGSTGKPKGTLITHLGLTNYLTWCKNAYPVAEGQGTLVHSSISFDLTITSLFAPLLVGRKVQLLPEDASADHLSETLRTGENFSLIKITPAHLQLLNTQLTPAQATGRTKAFIIGGENLLAESIAFWQEFAPDTILVNEYGPTETVVGCCIYQINPSQEKMRSIPIGRPIANTQLYILDADWQLVPVGVPGELYIGGAGLARGYLKQADITAAKFIPNPFSQQPGARLYKTGDLARYLSDGNIEFLGRIDHQIKLRGFRIELGEIEAVLSEHPAVRENVVLLREDRPGNKRLTAYIVLHHQETQPAIAELSHFLKEKLPDYMVPTCFVILEALPLTVNGKVDRNALPVPEMSREEVQETFVAPRTPIEELVAGIWSQVLGIKQVGIHDNFFALGGHSLLATQIISRIRDTFHVELPLRCLFESPTVMGLAALIKEAQHLEQSLPMLPITRAQELPLSFAQQRLWFLDQFAPGSSAYNISAVMQVTGSLNIQALEQSLTAIVCRHEVLRTTFATVEGQVVQVISPPTPWSLPPMDLQHLPTTEQQSTALQLATAEAQRPFDLAQGPLLRVQLLQLGEQEYIVLFTMHHIISDGWSMDVFIREMATLYTGFCEAKPSPLAELPIQYADFAYWQRQWLQGQVLADQLAYWQRQLGGQLPVLELPTDRLRPPVQTFRGARRSLVLKTTLTEALKQLSQQSGSTLFMTLLAAFKMLLWRYTGQEDILVGSPIAGRNRSEVEGLIGFFVNTLVLRTDLSGNPTFRTLLQRVRDVALGAYAHQDLPFERLVEVLQPERHLSHSPLFQVMFVLQNTAQEPLILPGITLSPIPVDDGTAKFDLTLSVLEQGEELTGILEYNTDLFDATTAERILGHWQTLLESIVANPDQQLSEVAMLTPDEQEQLQIKWNATPATYPKHLCIHSLFERQVEQTPNAIAVCFEDQFLTYQELNWRANQLADYLCKHGVGPETFVGIYVERSLDMVVGLLGILKAGAAYIPLDPKYPQERLAFMLADTQLSVLLTQQHLLAGLPQHQANVICLDRDWETIAQGNVDNLTSGVTASHLAYVIYTSGSTGKPKGVAIAHQSTVAFLKWASSIFTRENLAGVLAATSICFDLSIFEIFLPLSVGGKVILAENVLQLPHLAAFERVTLINTVPSAIAELVRVKALPASVQTVNLAGEPLLNSLVQEIYQQDSVQQVFNLYGPSEDTTYSTFTLVEKGNMEPVTIGRPIANTQTYLLDAYLHPVPVGVPGELYIGGEGLAQYYLNRPTLTAERFIPNPFSITPGARLYKTGDLARYLPNGNIEFLGRLDGQVKLRGFRIELGEIESVLSCHPTVRENVVIVREDAPGDKRLVVYLVPQQGQTPTVNELRNFLSEKLPNYMVPTVFVILESLPLTPNGKVDRRALPTPQLTRPEQEGAFVAPRTPEEKIVAGIWAEVLGLEQVGVHDNFFHLGGHSLLVVQVMSQLQKSFQIKLPLRQLFETSTVAELVQAIKNIQQSGVSADPEAAIALDLQTEAVLDSTICPGKLVYEPVVQPSAIFLTGATGFLGAFLLAELLQQTQANVYCLVRSLSFEAGQRQLQKNLESYLLWEPSFHSRIIPVLGDLSQPLLGLSFEQFQYLSSTIDVIYHNGALVNHVYPYALLKAANVCGTEEILRLASLSKIKPVHFISTTSVFSADEYFKIGVVKEDDPLEYSQGLPGGYAQSKWVAEKLVMAARDRGLPCCIYRFGRVGWHSQTGVWNTNDLLYRFIKGCIQLESVPDFDRIIEITPVDYISKALIHLSQQKASLGKAFHILNSQSVSWQEFVQFMHSTGYQLQQLSYEDWIAKLIHQTQDAANNALSPLVALSETNTSAEQTPDQITHLQFDCQNTLDGLVDTYINCPEINDELLRVFFAHFMRSQVTDMPKLDSAQRLQGEKNGTAY